MNQYIDRQLLETKTNQLLSYSNIMSKNIYNQLLVQYEQLKNLYNSIDKTKFSVEKSEHILNKINSIWYKLYSWAFSLDKKYDVRQVKMLLTEIKPTESTIEYTDNDITENNIITTDNLNNNVPHYVESHVECDYIILDELQKYSYLINNALKEQNKLIDEKNDDIELHDVDGLMNKLKN